MKPMEHKPIIIDDVQTWPSEITDFIVSEYLPLYSRSRVNSIQLWKDEFTLNNFESILKGYSLIGYHSTRLTPFEIDEINNNGMYLPNKDTLKQRIQKLCKNQIITTEIAQKLIHENYGEYSEPRESKIWFCFYLPLYAGQFGIERFFKFWGGEALYNFHKNDSLTGSILTNIGTPCVIKCSIPMRFIPEIKLPSTNFVTKYLLYKGYDVEEYINYESFSISPLEKKRIIKVIQFPSKHFKKITGIDNWC